LNGQIGVMEERFLSDAALLTAESAALVGPLGDDVMLERQGHKKKRPQAMGRGR